VFAVLADLATQEKATASWSWARAPPQLTPPPGRPGVTAARSI